MHYLICDLNIQKRGHYIGYNQYILNNIDLVNQVYPDRTYSFLYNTEAKDYLNFPSYTDGHVHFLNDSSLKNPSMKGKIALFRKAVAKAKELQPDHMIFMDLDQYQFPIFISKFSFKLSGVLFRPHHRINFSNDSFSARISSTIQRFKKVLAEKFLTVTRQVENIYILNDQEGVSLLNKFHSTSRFKYLPDPIFSYPSSLQTVKENSVFRFLIFGAINERKNITTILKAYDAAIFASETELIIVGHVKENYLKYVNELIGNLTNITAKKRIVLKPGFVSNEEMDNYFHQANACLLIYKDFFGSSGLLGRAALHRKKVIGANVGLLKELIEQNTLGIVCDPNSTEEISKALVRIVDVHIDDASFESFFNRYSPEKFIKTLLS